MDDVFLEFDEIGYWSEIKLEIIRDYAAAYSRILNAKKLIHIYIDAFSGPGRHLAKSTGEFVPGSPTIALKVQPPFREYHFIDMDAAKVDYLRRSIGTRQDVSIYSGDCNDVLINKVFPTLKFESYRRALCLLDPYGLNLKWQVLFQAGQLGTIDMFLNFPVMGMNRNVLWRDPERVSPARCALLDRFWGDNSWTKAAYSTSGNLFGFPEKESNDSVAIAFQNRLMDVAGFKHVPDPLPMRNSVGATVYYLFFASQVGVAGNIVSDIFAKYAAGGDG
jgi:three-Cys-motif partner protein